MPKIAHLDLAQVNKQVDRIDKLEHLVGDMKVLLDNVGHQTTVSDPSHAPQTTNNIAFTWTGATLTLSWAKGFIKDKNWNAQSAKGTPVKSSAPGAQHQWLVPAGSLSPLNASTYYWMAWDPVHQVMRATTDASVLHSNYSLLIICQLFTGTGAQSGSAGGGGSNGGVDFSGTRYKNF